MSMVHTRAEPDWRELVAAAMRNARQVLGLHQEGMAALLGCSQGLISKYENGRAIPPGDVLIRCIHTSGVSILSEAWGDEAEDRWAAVLQALGKLDEAIHSARQYMGAAARTGGADAEGPK